MSRRDGEPSRRPAGGVAGLAPHTPWGGGAAHGSRDLPGRRAVRSGNTVALGDRVGDRARQSGPGTRRAAPTLYVLVLRAKRQAGGRAAAWGG